MCDHIEHCISTTIAKSHVWFNLVLSLVRFWFC